MPKIKRKPICFVISSPSGGGKTTMVEELLSRDPMIRKTVSHTTRNQRPNETDGIHYHFVDEKKFHKLKKDEKFLEWAEVYGNYYATSKQEIERILKKGNDVILVIENKGAKAIRKLFPTAIFILVVPPSLKELKSRISGRAHGGDDIHKRLTSAKSEVRSLLWYDYVIINHSLVESIELLHSIVRAERAKLSIQKSHILKQF